MIRIEDLNKQKQHSAVQTSLSKSPQDAIEIAESFGYPVALKIESSDILHKSDIGAVKFNLKNKKEILKAYDEITTSVNISCPSAKIEGISVQEMLPEGFEIIMGYTYDKVFGPVLMAGMGGIFTEALKDISFRALPITKDDAVSMITSLKSSDMLLKGFRHIKKIPIDVISEVIIKASNLAMDNISKISSFDINPAIFYGSDYRIVDFKYTEKNDITALSYEEPDIRDIDKFFTAESIAVIGASPVKDRLGYVILDNLMTNGYKGRLYPVNPKYDSIFGLKSYPAIETMPDNIELVIITISLTDVPEILTQCSKKGIRNAIIISAGGKESGHASIEEEIGKAAEKYKIRVMGCNCIGVYDARTKIDSMFFSYNNMSRPDIGDISLMSQSGTVGLTALDVMPSVAKLASYGNRIDVDEADLAKYFSQDKVTKVISVYIEGLTKGRKFYDCIKTITPNIPVVVYKAGRSDLASKAAMSHTGFLSGTHNMISGILSQAHAVQV
ncbi:MAG: acetate--CoA ligase family protein, partial [Actinobacteria bacterium]|nr:acetate--CoA ligase family protein [Actinomycetota bacterium]